MGVRLHNCKGITKGVGALPLNSVECGIFHKIPRSVCSCQLSPTPLTTTFRVHLSCTSPKAGSMGLARGQYVGNHSNAKRGWVANHCSTAVALCILSLSTTTEIRLTPL